MATKAKKKTRVEEVTEMLKRKTGATAAAIAERYDLEEHTVRAMISRIGESVSKMKEGNKPTVYRITEPA